MPASPITYVVEVRYDLPARYKKDPVSVTVETLVPATAIFATQTTVMTKTATFTATGTSGSTTTISYTLR